MGAGKTILLVFMSILLVLSLVFLGIFWSVNTFLYPQVYEKILSDNNAYDLVNVTNLTGGSFIKVPEGGTESLVNSFIENTLSYLRGDSEQLNLTVEVDTQKLDDFFLESAENFRICDFGEEPFNGSEPICRPANVNASAYLDQVLEKNNFTITKGGAVNLADVFGIKKSDTENVRRVIRTYQTLLYLFFVFALVLITLMFFVSDSRTRWSGISLLISGIIIFSVGSIFFPLLTNNIPSEIEFLKNVSTELIQVLSGRMQLYSILVFGLGAIGLALSFFIKKKPIDDGKKSKNVKK